MAVEIKQFTFNPFSENTFVLFDQTKDCVIIDPGCFDVEEQTQLVDFIESKKLNPVALLNTHCHIDHILGNAFITKTYGLYPQIHQKDLWTMNEMTPKAAGMYGIKMEASSQPKKFLLPGEVISFGDSSLEVRFTPGHAMGHVVFVNHSQKFVINGDVLFQGSIGRTDLPGCDHQTLMDSIKNQMYTLEDDYVVYTGHGPFTTIGQEKKYNPFIKG